MLECSVVVLEVETLCVGVILTGGHLVAELKLRVLSVAHAHAVDAVNGEYLIRHERAVIASADDEDVGIYFLCPLDVILAVRESGGSYREADYVELAFFSEPLLEVLFGVEVQQV